MVEDTVDYLLASKEFEYTRGALDIVQLLHGLANDIIRNVPGPQRFDALLDLLDYANTSVIELHNEQVKTKFFLSWKAKTWIECKKATDLQNLVGDSGEKKSVDAK